VCVCKYVRISLEGSSFILIVLFEWKEKMYGFIWLNQLVFSMPLKCQRTKYIPGKKNIVTTALQCKFDCLAEHTFKLTKLGDKHDVLLYK